MKYIPSALIGQMSRSQGSTTASRNRYGSYFRNRVVPVNTPSAPRSAARASFGGWSPGWKALDSAQRDGWNALAASVAFPDVLGIPINLSGFQLYVSANQQLYGLGSSPIDTAPAWDPPVSPVLGELTVNETAGVGTNMEQAFTGTFLGGSKLVIEASGPVSAGKSMVPRSSYKRVAIATAFTSGHVDILSGYQGVFGDALPLGTKVFLRAKYVHTASGQQSPWVYTSGIVDVFS